MSEIMNQGKLAGKMVAAMKDIDAVLKNGRNDFQKYNYVRAADVANEAREAMIAHGIAFTYDVVDAIHWESTKEGKSTNYFCQLTVMVTFTDADSGEQMSGRVVGWGSDTLDKAPFKAMTGAVKYALRMNFLIPDENDPENDSQDRQVQEQPQVTRRPPVNMDAEPNEFDTHMAASVSPPIEAKQGKMLYAIAMGKQWDTATYRNWINKLGFSRDLDIPAARFKEIKAKLEAA